MTKKSSHIGTLTLNLFIYYAELALTCGWICEAEKPEKLVRVDEHVIVERRNFELRRGRDVIRVQDVPDRQLVARNGERLYRDADLPPVD